MMAVLAHKNFVFTQKRIVLWIVFGYHRLEKKSICTCDIFSKVKVF